MVTLPAQYYRGHRAKPEDTCIVQIIDSYVFIRNSFLPYSFIGRSDADIRHAIAWAKLVVQRSRGR